MRQVAFCDLLRVIHDLNSYRFNVSNLRCGCRKLPVRNRPKGCQSIARLNEDLKDLGVAKLADRKRLLNAIANLASDSPARDARPSQPATAAGEHRQVTVLFADIAGFTRLTTELGAENIHSLLNRYFETVDAIVANYGGTVDKHIGDNVMAVFGAPIAHDDDPLRAVRAAFEIHRQVGQLHDSRGRKLEVHVGIASGQVVASGTGSDKHREYTVTGDSVNLGRTAAIQGRGW